ncbi:hypothetical protein BUE80_DR008007 [Diplocarpon rosae]|nr:hypothetical protein BUE80_DR008007 [Diplocarpon rosae]
MAMNAPRTDEDPNVVFISPQKEVTAGLWTLFAGAFLFLALRIYSKVSRRNGLWYDDHILIFTCTLLFLNDIIITVQYATGYSKVQWDDRMRILINISSGNTIWGQALSKTALGFTLLRMANRKQSAILWFCIFSMNAYTLVKFFFIWAKFCNKEDYQSWYRLDGPCLDFDVVQDFKLGGNRRNGMSNIWFSAEVAGTIIVQCVPILRTFVRDIRTYNASKRLGDTEAEGEELSCSRPSVPPNPDEARVPRRPWRSASTSSSSSSSTPKADVNSPGARDNKFLPEPETTVLHIITEENSRKSFMSDAPSDSAHSSPTRPVGPLSQTQWRTSAGDGDDMLSPGSWIEPSEAALEHRTHGLSPTPPLRR